MAEGSSGAWDGDGERGRTNVSFRFGGGEVGAGVANGVGRALDWGCVLGNAWEADSMKRGLLRTVGLMVAGVEGWGVVVVC